MTYLLGGNNDLVLIVRINEDIKKVVRLARSINMLALNAILMSRRAGSVALGFGVISNELRAFSKELSATMSNLTSLSYEAVQIVSSHQRYQRINQLLVLANINTQAHLLDKQLLNSYQKVRLLSENLHDGYHRLGVLLTAADEGSRFGSVISRSLKIEATYGGSFRVLLSQIAKEFGDYIDSIPAILSQLKIYLQGK